MLLFAERAASNMKQNTLRVRLSMKRCPTCQSIYTDDSLVFCLQDGSRLELTGDAPVSPLSDEATILAANRRTGEPPPTEILDHRSAPTVKINASVTAVDRRHTHETEEIQKSASSSSPSSPSSPSSATASPNRLLTTGVIMIAVLLLALVGIGIAFLFRDGTTTAGNVTRAGDGNQTDAKGANGNGAVDRAANDNGKSAVPVTVNASASSTRAAYKGIAYGAANTLDANAATAWIEGAAGPGTGEWIRFDFSREVALRRITISPGYFKDARIFARNNRLASATLTFSDGTSRDVTFPDRMEKQTIDLGPVKTLWVRVTIKDIYRGADPDTAISDVTFDWE